MTFKLDWQHCYNSELTVDPNRVFDTTWIQPLTRRFIFCIEF
jgi:hypothetical protein